MPRDREPGPFEAAYTAAVSEAMSPPSTEDVLEVLPRLAPTEAIALRGCVLTPNEAIENGYVVVGAGRVIQAVQASEPQGVTVHDTGGVILPGLIDLHGHPEFNGFAAWEPPKQFVNRYAWRDSPLYDLLVRLPQDRLKRALPAKTQLRYSEIRALVGGVTAIQGTGGQAMRTSRRPVSSSRRSPSPQRTSAGRACTRPAVFSFVAGLKTYWTAEASQRIALPVSGE